MQCRTKMWCVVQQSNNAKWQQASSSRYVIIVHGFITIKCCIKRLTGHCVRAIFFCFADHHVQLFTLFTVYTYNITMLIYSVGAQRCYTGLQFSRKCVLLKQLILVTQIGSYCKSDEHIFRVAFFSWPIIISIAMEHASHIFSYYF